MKTDKIMIHSECSSSLLLLQKEKVLKRVFIGQITAKSPSRIQFTQDFDISEFENPIISISFDGLHISDIDSSTPLVVTKHFSSTKNIQIEYNIQKYFSEKITIQASTSNWNKSLYHLLVISQNSNNEEPTKKYLVTLEVGAHNLSQSRMHSVLELDQKTEISELVSSTSNICSFYDSFVVTRTSDKVVKLHGFRTQAPLILFNGYDSKKEDSSIISYRVKFNEKIEDFNTEPPKDNDEHKNNYIQTSETKIVLESLLNPFSIEKIDNKKLSVVPKNSFNSETINMEETFIFKGLIDSLSIQNYKESNNTII